MEAYSAVIFEPGDVPSEYRIKFGEACVGVLENQPDRFTIYIKPKHESILPQVEKELSQRHTSLGRSQLPRVSVWVGDCCGNNELRYTDRILRKSKANQ